MEQRYDKGFLEASFLTDLTQPKGQQWLEVDDIRPKQNHRVLLYSRHGDQEVGSLDHRIGMWIVRGQPVPFETFTHWQFLPNQPVTRDMGS